MHTFRVFPLNMTWYLVAPWHFIRASPTALFPCSGSIISGTSIRYSSTGILDWYLDATMLSKRFRDYLCLAFSAVWDVLGIIPHDFPICFAVNPLSPVSIQTCMPASLKSEIHRSTLFCKTSSTPVTPKRVKSDSTSSHAMLSHPYPSLFASTFSSSLKAKTRVRSPFEAKSLISVKICASEDSLEKSLFKIAFMASSEPLT